MRQAQVARSSAQRVDRKALLLEDSRGAPAQGEASAGSGARRRRYAPVDLGVDRHYIQRLSDNKLDEVS